MSDARPWVAIVLAAGEGTRMRSRTPKVLHEIAGRSMLGHVLSALEPLSPQQTAVVVGHGREQVSASLPAGVMAVVQEQQNGTGHAVRVALEALADQASADGAPDPSGAAAAPSADDPQATVVVVPGDAPLLTAGTLTALCSRHREQHAAATLLTAVMDDPTGYGRVVRDGGSVRAVIEQRDADEATLAVREVAVSVYAFAAGALRDALSRLTTDNAQGEEYLTDVIALLVADGAVVQAHASPEPAETMGVNDRVQLATAGGLLNARLVEQAQRSGVTVVDPATTWLGLEVSLEPDVTLLPGTRLVGTTSIARGAIVGPDTTLTDTVVGEDARVRCTTADGADIGPGCEVGPYTYLRPGTRLASNVKAGAFVEMKAATVGAGSKVPHLTYVGDAEIGTGSNIGCATVFVNYDGVTKSRTTVGDHVKIGSDTMLVAPVTVGDGAYTAAGSVITDDVPSGAIGVARARQRNVEGWVERRRAGTASAEAARAAARPASQTAQQQPATPADDPKETDDQ